MSIIEWISVILVITSVGLTSLDIYPYNVIIGFVANCMWAYLAILWDKKSLLFIQIALNVIYVAGLVVNFLL